MEQLYTGLDRFKLIKMGKDQLNIIIKHIVCLGRYFYMVDVKNVSSKVVNWRPKT